MIRWLMLCMHVFLPSWRHTISADSTHAYGRTLTKAYTAKKSMVKNFWLVSGILMVVIPVPHFVIALTMFTTFLSFMYLDET